MSNEITAKLECRIKEICNILESKNFKVTRRFILDATYFIPNTLILENMNIREILSNTKLVVPPPIEYRYLINEFNRIGNNLNQLMKQVNATHSINENDLINIIHEFKTKINELNKIILYGNN